MFFTKKRVLLFSFVGILFFYLTLLIQEKFNLFARAEGGFYEPPILACFTTFVSYILLFFIPVFILNIIIYKLRDGVFLLWRKFTFIYLFIYLFIIILSAWRRDDLFPIEKSTTSLFFIFLYLIIAILIIIYYFFRTRNK